MTTTAETQYEVGTTVHVAPTTLLLARNVREAKPDAALVKSVKDLGVIEPITAVLTEGGGLLVRFGHRRTLAAIEAERATVPVYITDHDSTDTTDEVTRVIAQHDENTHRAGLTTAEQVGVVETLTGLGLSAAQITKKARIKRDAVDHALTVSGSALARKATERYEELTLDQAAVVAEFEDAPEAVKVLITAAHEGRFEHAAQRVRDDRATAKARAEVLAMLESHGVTVIERPGYEDKKVKALDSLTASAGTRTRITPEEHRECPGHVAWLGTEWVRVDANGEPVEQPDEPDDDADEAAWDAYHDECDRIRANSRNVNRPAAVYGCNGWKTHGHHDPSSPSGSSKPSADQMSEEEREAAKKARALVIENNKAWAAAQPVRREFLAKFAKVKTAPKGTSRFLAVAVSRDPSLISDYGTSNLAAQWLGAKTADYGRADLSPAKSATEAQCLMRTLVTVLAAYENGLSDRAWRENGETNAAGRYLRFLSEKCGYTLSDVEQYAASKNTA